ncbi:MAG: hypothetical protein E7363_02975 [Clostridiales bacterium]|nr:hypothetical protein [Clostridiales bacterium]
MNVIRMISDMPTFEDEIKALQRNEGSCDEVWFGIYYYTTLEEHEQRALRFKKAKELAEAAGYRAVFEMGSTLGHVPEMPENEVTKHFRKLTDYNGNFMPGAFCPRGENLIDYQTKVVKTYMQYRPFAMYIDDDMRLEFRNGVGYGCFCDECIRLFNEKRGSNLTRAEIRKKFLTDGKFRAEYIAHNNQGMEEYAYSLAKAAAEVSPESFVGFENCFLSAHNGGNLNHIFNGLYRGNGKPPFSRGGAFHYNDAQPRNVLDKVLNNSLLNKRLPDYVTVRRPEIENTDNTSMGKSVRGTMMEAELNLALSCTGVSFHFVGQECEEVPFEERYFKALSKERKYFEAIKAWRESGKLCGLHPFVAEKAHEINYVTEEEYDAKNGKVDESVWSNVPKECGRELWQTGLPLSYEDERAYLLHSAMVKYLTDAEIEKLLSSNVLTDGLTVLELEKRGYGKDIPVTVEFERIGRMEEYVEKETARGIKGRGHTDFFIPGAYLVLTAKEGANITPLALSDGDLVQARVTTAKGGTWHICGYSLFHVFVNANRRRFMLNAAWALTGGNGAMLTSPEQAVVLPRVNAQGKCTGVYTHSISIGDSEALTYEIVNPKGENFRMLTSEGEEISLTYEKQGDTYVVTAPPLKAYRSTLILCE